MAQPAASDVGTVTSSRRFDILPDNISPELREACIEASRRIRLERRTAFGRRVVLEGGHCELMVEPIDKRKNRLHVPFAFKNDKDSEGAQVQGELDLIGTDPLPVLITADVSDSAAYTAWAYMLLGFAELTCNSPEPVVRESYAEHPRFLPRDHLRSSGLALAGFLAGYRGLTREAYALDLRQFTTWCRPAPSRCSPSAVPTSKASPVAWKLGAGPGPP